MPSDKFMDEFIKFMQRKYGNVGAMRRPSTDTGVLEGLGIKAKQPVPEVDSFASALRGLTQPQQPQAPQQAAPVPGVDNGEVPY